MTEIDPIEFGRLIQAVQDQTKSLDLFTSEFQDTREELHRVNIRLERGDNVFGDLRKMMRIGFVWLGLLTVIEFPAALEAIKLLLAGLR